MSAVSPSSVRLAALQGGMTLIEALVAVLVLSIGLLGVAGLQFQALRNNYGAHLRSQATILAHDIADRMRANRTEALAGAYAVDVGAVPTGTTLPDLDVAAWKDSLAEILPAGDGRVEMIPVDPAIPDRNVARIRVQWTDRLGDDFFVTETEL
jgi:type IV pilus assembly protein PilV